MADIKIVEHVVQELPSERPLVVGHKYKVMQADGTLIEYVVDSQGEPVRLKGITNDESSRLDRLSSEQISKVESITTGDIAKLKEDYTKEEIDTKISDLGNLASSSKISLGNSTVLPVPPQSGGVTIPNAWVELAQNVTYTQAGGSPITGIDGHRSIAEWNNDNEVWSLVDMGELSDTSGLLEKGGYEGTANDLKNEIEVLKYNLPLQNDALNSDFSNGTTYWKLRTGGLEPTASGNTLSLTGDGTNTEVTLVGGGVQNPYVSGEKIYIRARARVTNSDALLMRLSLRQTAQTSTYFVQQESPVANQWYDLNRIVTIVSSTGSAGLNIMQRYDSVEASNGKTMEVQYVLSINLTKAFGAGNEPSLSKVNEILDELPNRWFEGRYDLYSTSKIINEQESQANQIKVIEKYTKNFLVNKFLDGNFSTGDNWTRTNNRTELSFIDNELVVKSLSDTTVNWRGFEQTIPTPKLGDKIYVGIQTREEVAKPSTSGIYLRGGVTSTSYKGEMVNTRGLDEWGYSSKIIDVIEEPSSDVSVAFRSNYPGVEVAKVAIQKFRYAVCLNLTEIFGAGNEPSLSYVDQLVQNNPNYWIDDKVSLADSLSKGVTEYKLNISAIPYNDVSNISHDNSVYPILFGVKNTTKLGEQTKPTGWLYYTPSSPYEVLYASGNPENPKKIFTWNEAITGSENLSPEYYSPIICKNGDIIFVFRGERSTPNPRRNPIIYKNGNYDNPEIIDFGEDFKPHAWLQNCGVEFIYDENCFIFAEYTRPQSITANIWKVTAPFDNPSNWRVVKSYPIDGTGNIEHFHTINYDPYNGYVYSSTGDLDSESNILESRDSGETWDVVTSGSAIVSRVLNFICQPEGVYWGTDDGRHIFWFAPRGSDGSIEWENRKILFDFRQKGSTQVTYSTCLIHEPRGILFLDRHDAISTNPLYVYFYDLENSRMHIIDELHPINGEAARYGFRNDAVSFYPSISANKIVCGFGYHPNEIELENNGVGSQNNRLNNLTLTVEKTDISKIIPFVG